MNREPNTTGYAEMATETAPTPVGARACAGTTAFAAALSLAALACEADAPVAGNQADVVTDTIGDTVLVRTLAGSVWGADAHLGERIRYDVFEPDGAYLGAVDAPVEFKASVNPVFDGDHVWAVTRDELDVQRVVRYRIVR